MKSAVSNKFNVIFLFLLAFLAGATVILSSKSYLRPEVFEFEEIANNVLAGRGYTGWYLYTNYYFMEEPLYTILTVIVYFFFGHSYLIMLLAQFLIAGLLTIVIYKIAEDIFNDRIAFLSGLLVALHPALVYYGAFKLEYTLINALFAALCILVTIKFYNQQSLSRAIIMGIVFGLGLLTRGIIAIFIISSLSWLWLNKKLTLRFISLILISLLLTVSPWVIRNYTVYGKFRLFRNNGTAFWYGNNINATGSGYTFDGRAMHELFSEGLKKELFSRNELEQNKVLFEDGKKFILSHPFRFTELFLKKIYYFWWFSPTTGLFYPRQYLILYKGYYFIILLFAIMGLFKVFSSRGFINRSKCALLAGCFLFISLSHALFYVEGRHRWVIEPLLIIFSVAGYYSFRKAKLPE